MKSLEIADDPEIKKLLAFKGSDALCEHCWCPRAALNDYAAAPHEQRTAAEQRARNASVLGLAHAGRTWAAIEQKASELSTSLIPCHIYGWADRDSPETDVHRRVAHTRAHAVCACCL